MSREICVENIFIFIVFKKIHFLSLYSYINGCGVTVMELPVNADMESDTENVILDEPRNLC